jgi:hypothetical protein
MKTVDELYKMQKKTINDIELIQTEAKNDRKDREIEKL